MDIGHKIKQLRIQNDLTLEELAAAFGVMSIPTFVAINGGKEINRTVGAVPKETILKMLGR